MKTTFFTLHIFALMAAGWFMQRPWSTVPAQVPATAIDVRSATITEADPFVTDILTYTNIAREKKGLAPLVMKPELNAIAAGHSSDMATGKVPFSHDGFQERYQAARAQLKNVYAFAENVSFGPHSGKEAVEGWMNSKHHRENILGRYNSIGIGAVRDAKGTYYLTQIFCKE